ncbi:positive regulation of sphingomyelin catabolic process, partial [Pristimantis euphronides]
KKKKKKKTCLESEKTSLESEKTSLETEKTSLETEKTSLETEKTSQESEGTLKELHRSVKSETSEKLSPKSEDTTQKTSLESEICVEDPGKKAFSPMQISVKNFTFLKMLGDGGFGKVFLARENTSKEYVAVKVVEKERGRNWTDNSIVVERDILQLSSQSPHLIHGLAAFQTKSSVYYIMELATGGDMYKFIDDRFPFDDASLQFMAAEMVCGVQFLHRNGIIHRDLKPQNILMTGEGRPKITDFGLSITGVYDKTYDECDGTAGFAAPEMLNDKKHGPGVDYFSLGATLFEMSTNEAAFPGDSLEEYAYLITYIKPMYPDFLTPDTLNLLKGLLCKKPNKRLGVKRDIKTHPFFSGVNWVDVEAGRAKPPACLSTPPMNLDDNKPLDFHDKEVRKGRKGHKSEKKFSNFSFV